MKMLPLAGIGLAVVVAAAAGYIWLSSRQFADHIAGLQASLAAEQAAATPASPDLPQIVRDFAVRSGGSEGGPRLFHSRHRANLSTAKDSPPLALTSDQWTGTAAPGIVWTASGTMGILPVMVVDAYVGGKGELSARMLGAFQVSGGTGPDYDRGELMRYLSELPVFPDAILNNAALTWRQIDDRTVEVTGATVAGPAAMRFIFDAAGDIVAMEADDRPMGTGDGTSVPTPWRGLYGNYTQFGSHRIPAYGEVGWLLPDGLFTYWRGTVTVYEPVE